MQKILVTGGAGFISSHLCEKLLALNYEVLAIDNFLTGYRKNVEQLIANPNFKLLEADASEKPENYLDSNYKPDYIFHLASPASPDGYEKHPIETYEVNAFGTHYLTQYARKMEARILFSSTSEAYGDPEIHPQTEDYNGNVSSVGPRACYDESKRFGEMVCVTAHRQFGQDVRFVRIFNTYGPRNDGNDGRVIPTFITRALAGQPIPVIGDGSHTRSFCYVADLVEGLTKMMFSDNLAGEYVNLGNPQEMTILETAQTIKEVIGSNSEIIFQEEIGVRQGDPKKRCPNIDKAKKLLDWEPKISFREGLKPTIEYYKKFAK